MNTNDNNQIEDNENHTKVININDHLEVINESNNATSIPE